MGSVEAPLTPEQLRTRFAGADFQATMAQPPEPPEWAERTKDWQKML